MANSFMFLEEVVNAIHSGDFNDIKAVCYDGTNLALINYLYKNQCTLKEAAAYFEMEESEIKERIKNIALSYNEMWETKNHESFSKRGR